MSNHSAKRQLSKAVDANLSSEVEKQVVQNLLAHWPLWPQERYFQLIICSRPFKIIVKPITWPKLTQITHMIEVITLQAYCIDFNLFKYLHRNLDTQTWKQLAASIKKLNLNKVASLRDVLLKVDFMWCNDIDLVATKQLEANVKKWQYGPQNMMKLAQAFPDCDWLNLYSGYFDLKQNVLADVGWLETRK